MHNDADEAPQEFVDAVVDEAGEELDCLDRRVGRVRRSPPAAEEELVGSRNTAHMARSGRR